MDQWGLVRDRRGVSHLMAFDGLYRRAGRLLLPVAGIRRWAPGGCCDEPCEDCAGCLDGCGPEAFDVDYEGFSDNVCTSCGDLNTTTFRLDFTSAGGGVCDYDYSYTGPCGGASPARNMNVHILSGLLTVTVPMGSGSTNNAGFNATLSTSPKPDCRAWSSEAIGNPSYTAGTVCTLATSPTGKALLTAV